MSEVRERIDDFNWTQVIRGSTFNEEEFGVWEYFILKNNVLERNFQFNLAFKRIAEEEL